MNLLDPLNALSPLSPFNPLNPLNAANPFNAAHPSHAMNVRHVSQNDLSPSPFLIGCRETPRPATITPVPGRPLFSGGTVAPR